MTSTAYKSLRTPKPAGFGGSVSVVRPAAGSAENLPLLKHIMVNVDEMVCPI